MTTLTKAYYTLAQRIGAVLAVFTLASIATPVYALNDATASTSFQDVGNLGGSYGILIADHWVLTASHVAQAGVMFSTNNGSAVTDAAFLAPGASFPANDLALLHLDSAITSSYFPTLNATLLTSQTAPGQAVTLATASSYVQSSLVTAVEQINQNGVRNTVNYLVVGADGNRPYLQSGDSGSALFSGYVTNDSTALMLGVASSICNNTLSCYTQVAAYRGWIDSTLSSYGDSAKWSTSPVPEPDTSAQWLSGGLVLLVAWVMRKLNASQSNRASLA